METKIQLRKREINREKKKKHETQVKRSYISDEM